ncbi:hypothetical protein NKG05_16120 [Oerskovia sp. M15]
MGQPSRPRQQTNAFKALALLLAFVLVSAVGVSSRPGSCCRSPPARTP